MIVEGNILNLIFKKQYKKLQNSISTFKMDFR